jgi:hypothetical protein
MSMESAAVFMSASILITIGVVVIVMGIIIVNNLFDRYWRPVKMFKYEYKPVYYRQDEPVSEVDKTVEPKMEEPTPKK